jgi:hypothetical protein
LDCGDVETQLEERLSQQSTSDDEPDIDWDNEYSPDDEFDEYSEDDIIENMFDSLKDKFDFE